MQILTQDKLLQVSGGECSGGGNSNGGSVTCTVFENKRVKLELNTSVDARRGPTGGGFTITKKWKTG